MYRTLTKEESDNAGRALDEWWEKLDFNAKIHFRNLVEAVKHPIDPNLPVEYAEEQPAVETYTVSSCSCAVVCVACNDHDTADAAMCTLVQAHWNMHQKCCPCIRITPAVESSQGCSPWKEWWN